MRTRTITQSGFGNVTHMEEEETTYLLAVHGIPQYTNALIILTTMHTPHRIQSERIRRDAADLAKSCDSYTITIHFCEADDQLRNVSTGFIVNLSVNEMIRLVWIGFDPCLMYYF